MPKLVFIEPDGETKTVRALSGCTLLEAALSHEVRGLDGRCGGNCSCGSCHVRIRDGAATLRAASREELDVLAAAAAPPDARSRLACQVIVNEALDGMVVEIAEAQ